MTDASNISQEDKVADALKHSWVYHLPKWVWPYAQLARWERPIGWQLLMWPCWWSFMLVVLAVNSITPADGSPFIEINLIICSFFLALFTLGAFLMRGAGCTYNDLVDIDIDDKVARTRSRPLPSRRASKKGAIIFLFGQAVLGLFVLLAVSILQVFTFWLGVASLLTVAVYPFMKRITWWPQLFLGFAFSWGALMGWSVIAGEISLASLFLYMGSICWVIGYDTIYAHQDIEDDAIIGVKSTARLFGDQTKKAIAILYALALILFLASFWTAVPPTQWAVIPAYLGLLAGAFHMFWQLNNLDIQDGKQCLKLFKSNSHFGIILFTGLTVSVLLTTF